MYSARKGEKLKTKDYTVYHNYSNAENKLIYIQFLHVRYHIAQLGNSGLVHYIYMYMQVKHLTRHTHSTHIDGKVTLSSSYKQY